MRGDPFSLDEAARSEVGEYNAQLASLDDATVQELIKQLSNELQRFKPDLSPVEKRNRNIVAVKLDNAKLRQVELRRVGQLGRHGSSFGGSL